MMVVLYKLAVKLNKHYSIQTYLTHIQHPPLVECTGQLHNGYTHFGNFPNKKKKLKMLKYLYNVNVNFYTFILKVEYD